MKRLIWIVVNRYRFFLSDCCLKERDGLIKLFRHPNATTFKLRTSELTDDF